MLTPAQRTVLRTELLSDPLGVGYAVMNHDAAADALNAPTRTVHRRIGKQQLLRWAAATGAIRKLRLESATGTNVKQAASEAALTMLGSDVDFLVFDSEVMAMMTLLVTGGVITKDDANKLLERAAENVSRCDELLGAGVVCDNQDVYVARVEMNS